jgi:hypothetical protein
MHDAQGTDKMGLHARWLLGELMRQVKPCDLAPEEIMGFLAILSPAHNRKLALAGNPRGIPVVFVDPETGHRWDFSKDSTPDLG